MIVYLARAIQAFVMYCVNGTSGSSLLIESTDSMILCSFKSNLFSNFILLGDFNVDMLSHHSHLYKHLTNILNSFSLIQVVKEPTHFSSEGSSSLIDLVIMSAPQSLHECVTIPPLANSDHLGISLQVKSNIQTHVCVNKRVIWRLILTGPVN